MMFMLKTLKSTYNYFILKNIGNSYFVIFDVNLCLIPKYRTSQVALSPNSISPVVTPAISISFIYCVVNL